MTLKTPLGHAQSTGDSTLLLLDQVSLRIPVLGIRRPALIQRLLRTHLQQSSQQQPGQVSSVLALDSVTCQINRGERVALIGRNGAGKTTLLKTIAGVYQPSAGVLQRRGKVFPMIEKSFLTSLDLSGFDALKAHYLMLHLKLDGFEDFCEDVISFSGLADFIHYPLKALSEGMASRLLFSMLTASDHECLAIDEMFGTGDAAFFEKAQVRLEAFIEQTGTLILASHSSQLLSRFCQRGLVFSQGKLVFDGLLDHALAFYQFESATCSV